MNKKILIVEDEQTLLGVLADSFTKAGFETFFAANGKDGLTSAFANHPDIILLDIIMPVMDGITMLEKLRKDQWGKDAKVILLTNLSDTEKSIISSKRGVFDYWIKCEMSVSDIINKVKEKLS